MMLKKRFGSDFFFLPLISSAGDLSLRNLVTRDYGFGDMYNKDGADIMATWIFDAIIREKDDPVEIIEDFSDLKAASKVIELPGWLLTKEEYEWVVSLKASKQIEYDISDYV